MNPRCHYPLNAGFRRALYIRVGFNHKGYMNGAGLKLSTDRFLAPNDPSLLHPGATPSFRSKADADGLIAKIRTYLTWMLRTEHVRGETLSGLYDAQISV
jgi:hypothetical protein